MTGLQRKKLSLLLGLLVASSLCAWIALQGRPGPDQRQHLGDGSLLVLNRALFGPTCEFVHGTGLEKLLEKLIPSNGIGLLRFKLERPTRQSFGQQGGGQLVAEFSLSGRSVANHPLVRPDFYRQFRCVIHGERGIDSIEEFWPGQFRNYKDGYFGYVVTSRFPRDSQWLWFRVEKCRTADRGEPWDTVAQFRIKNPAWSPNQVRVAGTGH